MRQPVDFDRSLEELTGVIEGEPEDAPTPLVEWIRRSWKKPLSSLSNEEIGRLVAQQYGTPYILDLIWPKLRSDPLFEGRYYPGDVLSNLIRWTEGGWQNRPEYRAELLSLFERALQRPIEENEGFLESLGLSADNSGPN